MTTQPEALRMAELLEDSATVMDMGREPDPSDFRRKAAAELRRLHAQRDALLEALKGLLAWATGPWDYERAKASCDNARAAIAAAEGEKG